MEAAILFAPLLGAIIAGLFGPVIGHRAAEVITSALVTLAAILSWVVFIGFAFGDAEGRVVELFRWFDVGGFDAVWSLRVDALTAVMLVVVNSVSALVHIYSIGYMHEDGGRWRFFAYLSLFTFAMLTLVTANNFLQLFFGWEGVGLASYLLIGFWFKKPSAAAAAIKAFVVNRVGDFGFALGIVAIFLVFGTLDFDAVFDAAPDIAGDTLSFLWFEAPTLSVICALLFIGCMGKSAQLFLHTWLPDAMEGPTPVSALIHAATMVTAGVFLVCRCAPLFELAPVILTAVTVIGALTAFFAATVGLAQNDIKRVIAYSTCSQLGYMFFAAGVGAYGAAMFHLFTHAFFKALLFLCAGAVIHGLHHEQDMRRMGGLRAMMPLTWILMLIGTVAITGVGLPGTKIGTAGFVSKDLVLEFAYDAGGAGTLAFLLGVLAAVLTSFYSWRLIFLTFHGTPRADAEHMKHAHDAPAVMAIPLIPLAVGALVAGAAFYPQFLGGKSASFWDGAFEARGAFVAEAAADASAAGHGEDAAHGEDAHGEEAAHAEDHGSDKYVHGGHHPPAWVLWAPTVAMAIGLIGALLTYARNAPAMLRWEASGGLLWGFFQNKWWFDELYGFLFVRPAQRLARLLWKGGDGKIIDGFGPDGVSAMVRGAAVRLSRGQTGYLYHYAFVMLIGLVALASWLLLRGGV